MMERLTTWLNQAKMVLTVGAMVVSMLVGAYHIATDHFLTRADAEAKFQQLEQKTDQLKKAALTNTLMIYEMKVIQYEKKIETGENLTPTEKRQYERLKKKLDKFYEEVEK